MSKLEYSYLLFQEKGDFVAFLIVGRYQRVVVKMGLGNRRGKGLFCQSLSQNSCLKCHSMYIRTR